jgi:hypothetical protein
MAKRPVLLFIWVVVTAFYAFGQSSEAGFMLGFSSYKGDITHSLFDPAGFKPAAGIFFKRSINNHWSHQLGLSYGTITGSDADSNDPFQLYRNLSFRSRILEGSWVWEFNFFEYQTANPISTWTPYLLAGLAVYRFNPKALLGDDWIELQPLGTEGQGIAGYNRKRYRRIQISIPFGGGIKLRLSQRFGLALEAGARRTFTDYLDDISTTYPKKDLLLSSSGPLAVLFSDRSPDRLNDNNNDRQRGDAAHKDWYLFAGVKLSYTLSKKYNDSCKPFKQKFR